jgi:hypothetical protein
MTSQIFRILVPAVASFLVGAGVANALNAPAPQPDRCSRTDESGTVCANGAAPPKPTAPPRSSKPIESGCYAEWYVRGRWIRVALRGTNDPAARLPVKAAYEAVGCLTRPGGAK